MIILELTEHQKLRAECNAWRLKARELEETVMKLNEERRELIFLNDQLNCYLTDNLRGKVNGSK